MSSADERRPVDFVVGSNDVDRRPGEQAQSDDGAVSDEELALSPGRVPIARRWVLGGAAVLLVAAALIARGVTGGHGAPSAASQPPAPSPTATARLGAPPTLGAPPIPSVSVRTFPPRFATSVVVVHGPQPAGCPWQATCYVAPGLPDASMEALRAVFPKAVLGSATSLLASRPGRFGPDLVSRSFVAHDGSATITVHIRKPTSGDASKGLRKLGLNVYLAGVVQVVPGFTVTVQIDEPMNGSVVALDYLVQLANDDGLVAPQ